MLSMHEIVMAATYIIEKTQYEQMMVFTDRGERDEETKDTDGINDSCFISGNGAAGIRADHGGTGSG